MALIECLIDRDGSTVINDGGFTFEFKTNKAGHCVCDVLADGVVRRLLAFNWFRKYRPEVDYADAKPVEEQAKIVQLREEGHSLRAIGSAVGRSPNYVSKVIKDHT